MNLSPHFTLEEMLHSDTAEKKIHEASLRRQSARSAEHKPAWLCFNGLYTPFGSPVIGGQKR